MTKAELLNFLLDEDLPMGAEIVLFDEVLEQFYPADAITPVYNRRTGCIEFRRMVLSVD